MTIRADYGRVLDLTGETDLGRILPWVEAANALVDAKLGASKLSEATLRMIEEHVAAHLYELGSGQVKTGLSLPDASWTYADASTMRATRNGRIAVELDTTGALAEASKPRAQFAVL